MSIAHEHLIIGSEMNGTLMTPEEFDTLEDWDEFYKYELINGVLIVVPAPSVGERGPNDLLGQLLRNYSENHQEGSACDYTVSEHTIPYSENRRRADRVVWTGLGRMPNERKDMPSIVIEFVSEGRTNRERDYRTKRREYAELGIREYWIIDRFERQMTVVRNEQQTQTEIPIDESSVYQTPLLPGFELAIARLFAEADKLKQAQEELDE